MTAPTAVRLWDELAALAGDAKGERTLLARTFQSWCQARGIAAAALYLEGERGFRREHAIGGGSFPLLLPKALKEMVAVELPGAVMLLPAGATGALAEADEPLQALLVAAVGLTRARAQLKQQHFQVNYRVVELEALYDVGLAIAGTLDLERLTEEILLRAVSLLDARRGALYVIEDGAYQLRGTIGGSAPGRIAMSDGHLRALLDDAPDTPQQVGELLPGATYALAIAIESDGKAEGVLTVGDKESRDGVGPFADNDRRTLSLFANQAAIALENAKLHRAALDKERLEREMELAADIQRRILPKGAPEIAGWDVAGWYRPARQVGGDYFDFLPQASGRFALTLGDVSGKGVPAALMVSTLHSALRLLLETQRLGPDLVARLNQHIVESSTPNKFITLFIAELDPLSGRLDYLNAGHNPGIVVRADGSFSELHASGLPLGLLPDTRYHDAPLQLDAGDLMCLFSDGITEAASPVDEEFGTERLVELLRAGLTQPLPGLTERIGEAVKGFAAGRPQGDDQTVVLLRRQIPT